MQSNIKIGVILLLILMVFCFGCSSDKDVTQNIMKSICTNDFNYFYGHSYDTVKHLDYIIDNYLKPLRYVEREKAYDRARLLAKTGDWKQYSNSGTNNSAMDYYRLRRAIGAARCRSIELKDKKNNEYIFIINGSLKIKITVRNSLLLSGDVVE